MTLVSVEYIAFLLIGLLIYYLLAKKYQWVILLLLSLYFYLRVGEPWTIIYVMISSFVTWCASNQIAKENNNAKRWVFIAIFINLTILFVLKYSNFFLGNFSRILNFFSHNDYDFTTNFISSLGISFYTLQMVGYLLDCYWGICEPMTNIAKVTLFNCFFPQMISGPINRFSSIKDDLFSEHDYKFENIEKGIIRVSFGIFKKIVIAGNFAIIANTFLNLEGDYCGIFSFCGIIAYIIELYADFSGCMDIVIGSAKCFDIRIVENFNAPFSSRTIQEFWQRWHITLGQWMKDYIMYPLLRTKAWRKLTSFLKTKFNKKVAQKVPTYLAMLILWFCMGLWHGGEWHFIIQGLWYWVIIVVGDCVLDKKKRDNDSLVKIRIQQFRTLLIFVVGTIFFKSWSVSNAIDTILLIFHPANIIKSINSIGIVWHNWRWTAGHYIELLGSILNAVIGFVIFVIMCFCAKNKESSYAWFKTKPIFFRTLIIVLILYFTIVLGVYGPGYSASEFIYGGF